MNGVKWIDFNPRTPVGCDYNVVSTDTTAVAFQSTHPSGVRRTAASSPRFRAYFNPRTPVGCDV